MITYIDLEGTIFKLQMNFKSMDQTLEAMNNELGDANINLSWRELEKSYRGYQNTLFFLKGEINQAFEELNAMVKADEKPEEDEEEAQA